MFARAQARPCAGDPCHSPPRAGQASCLVSAGRRPDQEDGVSAISPEPASPGPAILVEGLTKSFGDVHALCGIDLSVPHGTVLGVLRPDRKSTRLNSSHVE